MEGRKQRGECHNEVGASTSAFQRGLPDLCDIAFAVDDDAPTYRSISFAVPVEANTMNFYRGESRSVKQQQQQQQQQYNAPPKLAPFFCLARTTFHTQLSSAVVWPRLLRLARTNGLEVEDIGGYELRCSAFVHHSVLDFNCRLFQDGAGLLVEFRRSRGCGCAFSHLFRAFSKALQSPNAADDVAGALLSRVEASMSPPALPSLLLPMPAPLAASNGAAGEEALAVLAEALNGGSEDSIRTFSSTAADLASEGVDVLCSDAMATALEALLSSQDAAARAAAASAVASVAAAAAGAPQQQQKQMSAACQRRVARLRRCLRQLLVVCGDASCVHARREAAKALLFLSRTAALGGEVRALGGAEALRVAARCGAQDALLSRYASEALRNIQGAC